MREDESMKKLAFEIKSKVLPPLFIIFLLLENPHVFLFLIQVVERDTFIPFVSEGPTLILGADASCNVASVSFSSFLLPFAVLIKLIIIKLPWEICYTFGWAIIAYFIV